MRDDDFWRREREADDRRAKAQRERAERLRAERAAEWSDARHPNCCWRCGWSVTSHAPSSYGLDCPWGRSPAAEAGHLPRQSPRHEEPPASHEG